MRLRACFNRRHRTLLSPMGWGHRKPHWALHFQTTNHGRGGAPALLPCGISLRRAANWGLPCTQQGPPPRLSQGRHPARARQPPRESPIGCGSDSAAPPQCCQPHVPHPQRELTAASDSVSALPPAASQEASTAPHTQQVVHE